MENRITITYQYNLDGCILNDEQKEELKARTLERIHDLQTQRCWCGELIETLQVSEEEKTFYGWCKIEN